MAYLPTFKCDFCTVNRGDSSPAMPATDALHSQLIFAGPWWVMALTGMAYIGW